MFRTRSFGQALLALSVVAVLSPAAASAHESALGNLEINHAWSRATAPTAPTGAVYLSIDNSGPADRLVSAAGEVADAIEIHQSMKSDDDLMQMGPVDGVDIAADGRTELSPGGYHILLIGLRAPLKQGESFPLTLTFENAGTVTVDVAVQSARSTTPDD